MRVKEDEGRRQEVAAKFQVTINDITLKMQECHAQNYALKQDNAEYKAQCCSVII
jgi:hypothetical protein